MAISNGQLLGINLLEGSLGFKGDKGDVGEIGTPIPYNGTFEELKNSTENKYYNYIILDSRDTVYVGHWVYYDRTSSSWKDGGVYLSHYLTSDMSNRLNNVESEVQANILRQDKLERKYDEQLKELANGEPQLPEIVDARDGKDTLGKRLESDKDELQTQITDLFNRRFHFENINSMKSNLKLKTGDLCKTLGYYNANDGGEATYKIVDDSTLVDNGGNIHDLQNGLKAKLIVDKAINVRQFGAKGNGIDDDTLYIQNAINYVKTQFLTNWNLNANVLIFNQGTYKITNQLIIPAYLRVKSKGLVTFDSYVEDKSTIWINNDSSETSPILQTLKQQYSRGKIFDGSNGGFVLNKVDKVTPDSIGLEIGNHEANKTFPISRISFSDVGIYGFDVAMKINQYDTYLITFDRFHLEVNNINVLYGDTFGPNNNAGENFIFNECVFAGAKVAFDIRTIGQELNFNNCSFDFLGCIFKTYGGNQTTINPNSKGFGGYSTITVNNAHFEAIGHTNFQYLEMTESDVKGIIYNYNDKVLHEGELIENKCVTTLFLKNIKYIESTIEKLFTSIPYNNLKVRIDGFTFISNKGNTDATYLFLAEDNIDIEYKNLIGQRNTNYRLITKKQNITSFPEFENIEDGTAISKSEETDLGSFKINNVTNITSTICISSEAKYSENGKAIKLQSSNAVPKDNTDESLMPALEVNDNVFYEIPNDRKNIMTTILGKNKTYNTSYIFYCDFIIHFYDHNKNELTNMTHSNYAKSDTLEKWGCQYYPVLFEAPQNAKYFKIDRNIRIKGVNGLVQYHTLYLTGFYTFFA